MNPKTYLYFLLFLFLCLFGYFSFGPKAPLADPQLARSSQRIQNVEGDATSATSSSNTNNTSNSASSKNSSATPADPLAKPNTATSRDTQQSATTQNKKKVIDPMSTWQDLPPWPEGLPLYAEVETSKSRFVNLRPDDVGQLPRIQADATERIAIKISIPQADPGEKIHVELPNGGRFTDSENIGRVLHLDQNRTLSLDYITDASLGHCDVKFLHRGNTRSLPIWIGELP